MSCARFWLPVLAVALTQLSCKGQEVPVFETPEGGGDQADSGGHAGSAGSAAAGSLASAGDTGGVAGSADATAGGSGGMADGGPGGMAGAAGVPLGMPCALHADCGAAWFCEKPGCDAPSGVCEPRPLFLSPEPAPVCGCDGVSYWNDTIRRAHGATLDSPGECRASACPCEVGADCEVLDASCSHLVSPGEMCGRGPGTCWVLPPQCLPAPDFLPWQECGPPDDPNPPPCVDICLAIRSERPHAPPRYGDCR